MRGRARAGVGGAAAESTHSCKQASTCFHAGAQDEVRLHAPPAAWQQRVHPCTWLLPATLVPAPEATRRGSFVLFGYPVMLNRSPAVGADAVGVDNRMLAVACATRLFCRMKGASGGNGSGAACARISTPLFASIPTDMLCRSSSDSAANRRTCHRGAGRWPHLHHHTSAVLHDGQLDGDFGWRAGPAAAAAAGARGDRRWERQGSQQKGAQRWQTLNLKSTYALRAAGCRMAVPASASLPHLAASRWRLSACRRGGTWRCQSASAPARGTQLGMVC